MYNDINICGIYAVYSNILKRVLRSDGINNMFFITESSFRINVKF